MTNQEKKNILNTEKQNLLVEVAALDYKRLKNSEYSLVGETLPYDPVKLHEESQAYRDRINEIEEEIANIPDDEEVEPVEDIVES